MQLCIFAFQRGRKRNRSEQLLLESDTGTVRFSDTSSSYSACGKVGRQSHCVFGQFTSGGPKFHTPDSCPTSSLSFIALLPLHPFKGQHQICADHQLAPGKQLFPFFTLRSRQCFTWRSVKLRYNDVLRHQIDVMSNFTLVFSDSRLMSRFSKSNVSANAQRYGQRVYGLCSPRRFFSKRSRREEDGTKCGRPLGRLGRMSPSYLFQQRPLLIDFLYQGRSLYSP